MPELTLLLCLPVAGAASIALVPADRTRLIRWLAVATSAAALLAACLLVLRFDPSEPGMQLSELMRWNPRLGTFYALGVDGISLPLVVLATVLALIAVLASRSMRERTKGYYLLLLVLESAMLGVFMAQDWALFYVFWELTLIPLFFLIDRWGGKGRGGASLNFVLYTMGGSVFMLIALLMLFDAVPGHSFLAADLRAGAPGLPPRTQILIFLGLLIGFGVKMPILPLHGWLPLAHVQAPSPVSILLSGILLKMGAYGILRAVELLPAAAEALQGLLLGLALCGILYGGLLAWRHTDLKAMVAYSSVAHMGVVLLGIATLSPIGFSGAVLQMLAHGLVAGALFLLIGLLYERTHTREIGHYGSLVRVMPKFAFFTSLAFLAAVGLPGTAGFVAELHTLVAGFERWGALVLILSLGVLISAAYAIRTVGRLFTGPERTHMRQLPDLRPNELIAAAGLIVATLAIGIFPAPALHLSEASAAALGALFGG